MDDDAQAEAYALADFAAVNREFVDRLLQLDIPNGASVLDLGCGPGDICLRLHKRRPDLTITGVDGSPAMLRWAEKARSEIGAPENVQFVCTFIPSELTDTFDVVISNSLLHHLHDPDVLWDEVLRRARPGAQVLVVDLMRPESSDAIEDIVEAHAGSDHPILVRDFRASLHAAFTVDEIQTQLRARSLPLNVEPISDRHLCVLGRAP